MWLLPGGDGPTPVGYGAVGVGSYLPQPCRYAAIRGIHGGGRCTTIASDRPITVLRGFCRPATWLHRSRDVPTYDQQVRLTPVDLCLCVEG